jgi:hypothetical protein
VAEGTGGGCGASGGPGPTLAIIAAGGTAEFLDRARATRPRSPVSVHQAYDLDQQRQQANLLSAHVLYTFGQAPDDLPLALKLLANEERIGTVSARPEDNRNYVEIRELALMALLKMLGRGPQDIGGADRVTGYCGIKQSIPCDAIRDANRWSEIRKQCAGWVAEKM